MIENEGKEKKIKLIEARPRNRTEISGIRIHCDNHYTSQADVACLLWSSTIIAGYGGGSDANLGSLVSKIRDFKTINPQPMK
jgi:hypothetical protein